MEVKDLKYFFQEIQPTTLQALDKKRKTALYARTIAIAGAILLVLSFLGVVFFGGKGLFEKISPFYKLLREKIDSFLKALSAITSIPADWLFWICSALIIGLCYFLYGWTQKRYINSFKEQINKKLFKRMHPQIKYNPKKYISKRDFRYSRLFEYRRCSRYKGDDYCLLRSNNHLIEFSEVKASERQYRRKSTHYDVFFHGLFMKLHLNLQSSLIRIMPKQKSIDLLSWGKKDQPSKLKQKPGVSYDFDKVFYIHGGDTPQTQKILTDDFKKHLLQMQTQFGKDVYISIQNTCIYIAVECGAFFEPPFRKAIKEEELKKTALMLNSVIDSAISLIRLFSKPANQ